MTRELSLWRHPSSLLDSFRRDMDSLFTRFFSDWERSEIPWSPTAAGFWPQIESHVDGKTLCLKADLPGVDPQEVEITVTGNVLTLKGERKTEQKHEEGNYFHREVSYGMFERSFPLPEGVKAEDVQASYHNGVLELSIPLPEAMVPKKIAIEGQSEERKRLAA
jgi:HSP20 family protein